MNQTEYARHRGVSRQFVSQLVKAGRISTKNGMIDRDKTDQLLAETLDVRKARKKRPEETPPPQSSGMSYNEARRANEILSAKLKQQRFDERQGILINAEQVKRAAFDRGRRIRDALLNIPDRIAALLAAESDEFKVSAMLTREIKAAIQGEIDGS